MTSEVPLLDALFEHLDEYVVVTTRGTIVRANHAFAALLGRIPGDLVGHSLQSLIAAEDHPLLETLLAHEAAAGSAGPVALRLLAPDGSWRAIGWRACQVMVEDRPATMLIGRESSDGWQGAAEGGAWIAEVPAKQVASAEQSETIERLERQLRETRSALETMNRDLQSLDRLKADLVSTISHELRTPLVSVRGYADMLTTGRLGPLSDKQRHAVEVLLRNIDRLIHIIEKILTYSALENEQIPLQFQSVNLNTALASVARLNQPATGEQGVTIELDLPAEPVTIEADPHHLATLFHQLVSNAVKFNNPAGRVIIGARQVDDTAEVVIGDTGIGIPPERLNKIFERFYQVDNSRTRRYGGLGLGLAIAHRIVTLHGGTIAVQSEAETGSTFTVLLPVQRGASATLEAAAAEGVRTEH